MSWLDGAGSGRLPVEGVLTWVVLISSRLVDWPRLEGRAGGREEVREGRGTREGEKEEGRDG